MYKVYCDFDATVTENDIGNIMLERFGKPEAFTIWQQFESGRMTAAECITFACSTVAGADANMALELLKKEKLRPGFREFIKFCAEKNLNFRIVSDGFSSYIRPILEHHELDIPYHANTIEFTLEGTYTVELLNGRESCRSCASCKCAHIIETSSEEDTVVYIGDGYSDTCPVKIADVVFARNVLLRYCSENGIPHHPFRDFFEVESILKNYLADRPNYRREQARRNRKQLIMTE